MVGGDGHVYAADIQPAAADMVAGRARKVGVGNVTVITTDRDAELARVLKPGGVLSVWVERGAPEDALPCVTANSDFELRERVDDVLNLASSQWPLDHALGWGISLRAVRLRPASPARRCPWRSAHRPRLS